MWAWVWALCAAVSASFFFTGFGTQPAGAQAADPPPYPEFTFRRVTPPSADHDGPRIDIQIAPPSPTTPALPDAPAATVQNPTHDWFWSRISPDMPADPARFWAAQDLLGLAPEVTSLNAPRLSTLASIADTHGRDILMATIGTEVSPALALAVIAVESSGRTQAISSAGAQGLMQLIPATASRFGVTDPFDPAQNIAGGIAYLDWLIGEFGRDPVLVLAAYNAGEGAVTRAGGVPPYDETRAYVPKVLSAWMQARSLCLTPPELISDGCVFQMMGGN